MTSGSAHLSQPGITPLADITMLLVEDDDGDALIVEELLADTTQEVTLVRARSVAEAVGVVDERMQCVLLDLGLPDSDGLSGLRRLLAAAPHAAVIVLTGLLDEHRGVEALASGAQDYLVKGSVDGDLMTRAVRYALERKRNDIATLRLRESEMLAEENARLERGLLPTPLLRDPSLRVASRYRPGRHQALLGGDFFDVVEDSEGVVHVLMGDVMGHGPDEAALGVALRIAWRALTLAEVPEPHRLHGLQRILASERRAEEIFATVCTFALDQERRSGLLRLAGHPAPLVLGMGPHTNLTNGPALGVVDDVDLDEELWPPTTVELPAAWSLLFVTDGLLEARRGADGDRLDWEGVETELAPLLIPGWEGDRVLTELLARVEELNGGPLLDDTAMLLMRHS